MATKAQLAKIHIAKKDLSISEDNYRDILSAYDVLTAKDLSIQQAEDMLSKFKQLGWKPKLKPLKYTDLGNRNTKLYATPKQLRTIEWLWLKKSRVKTREALRNFIERCVKKSDMTFLEKEDASKIILALQKFKDQN